MSDVQVVENEQEVGTLDGVIANIAAETENLSAEEAKTLLSDLIEAEGFNDFKIGGVLSVIQSNKYWSDFGEYSSFKDYIVNGVGMEYRKAMYLITIYNSLIEVAVSWEKVADIGWTKLKEIAPILTKENAEAWIEKARVLNTIQLQEAIKQFKAGTLESTEVANQEVKTLTTLTFKVHADQKELIKAAIEKAKVEAGTEFDSVALEAICLNYSTGQTMNATSLSEMMEKSGLDEVIASFEKIWPHIDVQLTLPDNMAEQANNMSL